MGSNPARCASYYGVRSGHNGLRLEPAGLVAEISEIIVHEADAPNPVVSLLESDCLAGLNPSPEALAVVKSASEARARAILTFVYYVSARLFLYENHRENILRTPVTLLTGRFGPAIVPQEVAEAAPNLVGQLHHPTAE